jgi:hypothetical protein
MGLSHKKIKQVAYVARKRVTAMIRGEEELEPETPPLLRWAVKKLAPDRAEAVAAGVGVILSDRVLKKAIDILGHRIKPADYPPVVTAKDSIADELSIRLAEMMARLPFHKLSMFRSRRRWKNRGTP